MRRRVESNDAKFLTRVPYFALGILSHVTKLYRIRVHLQDFELSNIAGLIATAWMVERSRTPAARLLQEHSQEHGSRHWMRPSHAFATAYGFYQNTVGETVSTTLSRIESCNAGQLPDGIFRIVYRNLVQADYANWHAYWERRVQQQGLDVTNVKNCLSRLGREATQGERWQCLRMHFNALPADSRLRFVDGVDGQHPCYLCGREADSQLHIFSACAAVGFLKQRILQQGIDLRSLTYRQHCLDIESHLTNVAGV